jgi:hypothetical protein
MKKSFCVNASVGCVLAKRTHDDRVPSLGRTAPLSGEVAQQVMNFGGRSLEKVARILASK